jgi:hypothetical protein
MEKKFGQESEGPQWVQGKAPHPILDLMNFNLLLRGFPSFKMFSFCLNLQGLSGFS